MSRPSSKWADFIMRSLFQRNEGIALVFIAGAFFSILTVVGFAVDVANILIAQQRLQRAIDNAALGGMSQLTITGANQAHVRGRVAIDLVRDNLIQSGVIDPASTIDEELPSSSEVVTVLGEAVTVHTTYTASSNDLAVTASIRTPSLLLHLVPGFSDFTNVGATAAARHGTSARISLILDLSNSQFPNINGLCPGGGSTSTPPNLKIKSLIAAATEFILSLSDSDEISIITFREDAKFVKLLPTTSIVNPTLLSPSDFEAIPSYFTALGSISNPASPRSKIIRLLDDVYYEATYSDSDGDGIDDDGDPPSEGGSAINCSAWGGGSGGTSIQEGIEAARYLYRLRELYDEAHPAPRPAFTAAVLVSDGAPTEGLTSVVTNNVIDLSYLCAAGDMSCASTAPYFRAPGWSGPSGDCGLEACDFSQADDSLATPVHSPLTDSYYTKAIKASDRLRLLVSGLQIFAIGVGAPVGNCSDPFQHDASGYHDELLHDILLARIANDPSWSTHSFNNTPGLCDSQDVLTETRFPYVKNIRWDPVTLQRLPVPGHAQGTALFTDDPAQLGALFDEILGLLEELRLVR